MSIRWELDCDGCGMSLSQHATARLGPSELRSRAIDLGWSVSTHRPGSWRAGSNDYCATCLASRHDVNWYGDFRGPDNDPREVGFCQECEREVYDHDPDGHRRAP